tara:strand:+ start:238 stop:621 length:384 start_codon:yes stop_codon:yes gene_type:complete
VTKKTQVWSLSITGGKLFTLNTERGWHHHKRAKHVKQWREASCLVAQEMKMPKMEEIEVTFIPYKLNRKNMADTGGHFPIAKACIDGLIDAGVIEDDGPDVVTSLTFKSPYVYGGEDKAVMLVKKVS